MLFYEIIYLSLIYILVPDIKYILNLGSFEYCPELLSFN